MSKCIRNFDFYVSNRRRTYRFSEGILSNWVTHSFIKFTELRFFQQLLRLVEYYVVNWDLFKKLDVGRFRHSLYFLGLFQSDFSYLCNIADFQICCKVVLSNYNQCQVKKSLRRISIRFCYSMILETLCLEILEKYNVSMLSWIIVYCLHIKSIISHKGMILKPIRLLSFHWDMQDIVGDILITLLNSLVTVKLDYGFILWSSIYNWDIIEIELIHNNMIFRGYSLFLVGIFDSPIRVKLLQKLLFIY